jgi:uncharacterized protein with von Willebrand factor type A (vWA) domain
MKITYSAWDGTQFYPEFDASDILDEIADDLIYHGDVAAALRRLLKMGFETSDGERILGIKDILNSIERKKEKLSQSIGDTELFSQYSKRLDDILKNEREAISAIEKKADNYEENQRQITKNAMAMARMQLDLLPNNLAGKIQSLNDYNFNSSAAKAQYDELIKDLKKEMLNSYLNQLGDAVKNTTPEQMERIRQAMSALNKMAEQKQNGEEINPGFEDFMNKYGDLFGIEAETLDEFLEKLAARMATLNAMLTSMTPEQRDEFFRLSQQLMSDMDLQFEASRLAENMAKMMPSLSWQRHLGANPMGQNSAFAGALSNAEQLTELSYLQDLLKQVASPGALFDLDFERISNLVGPDAARSLKTLAALAKRLEQEGLIERRGEKLELTPKGMKKIGQNVLTELFTKLKMDKSGSHFASKLGSGHERAESFKDYEFGDTFHLNLGETLKRSVARNGPGLPVSLNPTDFVVDEFERTTRSATVIMIDLSLSMPMRDNFLPAKKTALAIYSLITSKFPQDYVGLVGFSEVAREIKPKDLPSVSWDFVYGTNMAHGLAISRKLLEKQAGTREIIMITDGEPTAHIETNGEVFFSYPPTRSTILATLAEVKRCSASKITINTFVLDATEYLSAFINRISRINKGRSFFTTSHSLGDFVLVDFLDNRIKRSKKTRSA